ncbi:hypothetical protein [Glutamicibacter sp. AOP3-A1-12]|uniref:hypothetical protein n=1 Tax=Glutamicibacter sp. AOP3-A1-12 TaxID=3457701 RepID=UPI0040333E7D
MTTEEKPTYEELERRNDSLARQIIGYQRRVNDSLTGIIREAKAEVLRDLANTGLEAQKISKFQAAWIRGEARALVSPTKLGGAFALPETETKENKN